MSSQCRPRKERDGQLDPHVREVGGELRADAGRHEAAEEAAILVTTGAVVEGEDVLKGDDVRLHADNLRGGDDASRAVLESRLLDDEVDGAGNLLADGANRELDTGHEDHRLETGETV